MSVTYTAESTGRLQSSEIDKIFNIFNVAAIDWDDVKCRTRTYVL